MLRDTVSCVSALLFVHRVIEIDRRVHILTQLERHLVHVTLLAAQELAHAGRAHHVSQHHRPVVHVVQVTDHVLVVQMDLGDSTSVSRV